MLVGDAAGHCFPLSGEGIRPSAYFADACGSLVCDVIAGRRSFLQALYSYRQTVLGHRRAFRIMRRTQDLLLGLPPSAQDLLIRTVSISPIRRVLEWAYDRAIPAEALRS